MKEQKQRSRIKLHSRDRTNNWLEHCEGNTYLLHSEYSVRVGYMDSDKEMIAFIDPSGGPFMSVGKTISEVGKEIDHITHIKGKGFAITFKE